MAINIDVTAPGIKSKRRAAFLRGVKAGEACERERVLAWLIHDGYPIIAKRYVQACRGTDGIP